MQQGVFPGVAAELEETLKGVSIATLEQEFARLRQLGKETGAIVIHLRANPPQPAAAGMPAPEQQELLIADRAELQAELDQLAGDDSPAGRRRITILTMMLKQLTEQERQHTEE